MSGAIMKRLLGLLFSTSVAFSYDNLTSSEEYPSSPPSTNSEISSRSNSPSLKDEAVFTWHGFVLGDPDVIPLVFDENLTIGQTNLVKTVLQDLSAAGNHYAQEALVKCWIDGSFGLHTTQINQAERLAKLWSFAKNNPLVHKYLVESYMEGYFGISPKKKSVTRKAKKFALKNLSSPGIGKLVIKAMRENLLSFKSRREYLKKVKGDDGKWVMIENKYDLKLIKTLAESGVEDAQIFLIICYMENKYGADSSNKNEFEEAMNRMEALDHDDSDLGVLLISIWEQDLLRYGKKKRVERLQEISRLRDKYSPITVYEYNPFSILAEIES